MKVGILAANTGRFAEPEAASELAQAAEVAGIESLWTAEHVLWPTGYASAYPYAEGGKMPGDADTRLPDPFVWLTWVGARTSTIRLATGITIVPQRHPGVMAKEVATLDFLSGGRVLLGVGVGWLEEEFKALGVPFADRGRRTDDYIAAMRVLWAEDDASYHGPFVSFSGMSSNPKPPSRAVPIIVGGHSPASARRAGRIGDGFVPLGGDIPELVRLMRKTAAEHGRDPMTLEVTASHEGLRRGDPSAAIEDLAAWGVDRILLPAHRLERGDLAKRCAEWVDRLGDVRPVGERG
ncbi:LLM class F420-dependent oxidoreductase [Acidiferrimicrobium sp. IK]|uniref:LLM class F420-dependent oxidoreductase n=1 Tax=Acidiferrimicrobium sp. IK TaxID=2871700 RepID=UPI0021CB5C3C|nr:LLM class F420-dependent oxidoreductase [Acidiferrimicrobium sp. IK]MCU4184438.1 LLM class F420-dependent oxidoreductase [Acidiferrimicrobium sp. IK]